MAFHYVTVHMFCNQWLICHYLICSFRYNRVALTVVTEATAAGEQSTSGTSSFTACHEQGCYPQRSKHTNVFNFFYAQEVTLSVILCENAVVKRWSHAQPASSQNQAGHETRQKTTVVVTLGALPFQGVPAMQKAAATASCTATAEQGLKVPTIPVTL